MRKHHLAVAHALSSSSSNPKHLLNWLLSVRDGFAAGVLIATIYCIVFSSFKDVYLAMWHSGVPWAFLYT
jgi:hypothetical protein